MNEKEQKAILKKYKLKIATYLRHTKTFNSISVPVATLSVDDVCKAIKKAEQEARLTCRQSDTDCVCYNESVAKGRKEVITFLYKLKCPVMYLIEAEEKFGVK